MDILYGILTGKLILLNIGGYGLSWLEFLGTSTGMVCVWLAAREKMLTWPFGIVNAVLFGLLFYQSRLYADFFLQWYFLATSIYGWWRWANPRCAVEADSRGELAVSRLSRPGMFAAGSVIGVFAAFLGYFLSHVHTLLPSLFPEKAAFPYADAATTAGSIVAQVLMARKKLECWLIWVCVDILAVVIYMMKGLYLLSAEYLVFGLIAADGYFRWKKDLRALATEKINAG